MACEFLLGVCRSRGGRYTSPKRGPTRSAARLSRWPTASPTWESYLARGYDIDDFAEEPLRRFLQHGIGPGVQRAGVSRDAYGAVEMKNRYGAERAQPKLKYPRRLQAASHARPGDRVQRYPHTMKALIEIDEKMQQPSTPTPTTKPSRRPDGGIGPAGPSQSSCHQRGRGVGEERNPNQGSYIIGRVDRQGARQRFRN